jgi:DNA processing protein
VRVRHADHRGAERDLEWAEQSGRYILRLSDQAYPPRLREIFRPPPVLFVSGDVRCISDPQLATVGSRHPTPAGQKNAQAFAAHSARAGLIVTSGLASGIDGAAHEGALAAGGYSVAVAATGLDRVYPARHRALAERLIERGAIVSEFPTGVPPKPENFPRRNRLISGLSVGVLVVEAAPAQRLANYRSLRSRARTRGLRDTGLNPQSDGERLSSSNPSGRETGRVGG